MTHLPQLDKAHLESLAQDLKYGADHRLNESGESAGNTQLGTSPWETILAVVGTYGVVAYLVAQRLHEFGVRLALGASGRHIVWLVVRYGLLVGLAPRSLVVRKELARLLYGLSASDPLALAAGRGDLFSRGGAPIFQSTTMHQGGSTPTWRGSSSRSPL